MVIRAHANRAVRPAPEVALSGITKRFGRTRALEAVDLRLQPGCIHAILGENGAGKSTLMRVLFGLIAPDSGSIQVGGICTVYRSPRDAITAGVGMVQQHFSNVAAFTVAENVALGSRGRFSPAEAARRVLETSASTGLELDPAALTSNLTVGAQQRLEIIKALAHGARVLILDEPTAVLAPAEAAQLLAWLRSFATAGGSVALVTHKVLEALGSADHISVLRRGRLVVTGSTNHFTADALASAMFPDAPTEMLAPPSPGTAQSKRLVKAVDLSLRGAQGETRIAHASFTIHAGEIVGFAAVEQSGHSELLRALAGLFPVHTGELRLSGRVSYVPEDRHRDALILDFPLYENLALRNAAARSGLMDWTDFRHRTRDLLAEYSIQAESPGTTARQLSGGNQQRFVLGRELEPHPDLLVVENPTRGLDLRATMAIHQRLRMAASAGAAVAIYSSDIDEVLLLASRILVVFRGTVREVPVVRELVGRAMLGAP
ncbi:MAG: ABC transporter ATP-binding protein [Gemmatimonadaceae bacterium]